MLPCLLLLLQKEKTTPPILFSLQKKKKREKNLFSLPTNFISYTHTEMSEEQQPEPPKLSGRQKRKLVEQEELESIEAKSKQPVCITIILISVFDLYKNILIDLKIFFLTGKLC